MPKITGILKIYLNGELQREKEGASIEIGGKERTTIVGHEVYGPSDKVMQSKVEWTVAHAADTDLKKIGDLVDATLRVECDTGIVYLIGKAWCMTPPKLTGTDGEATISFEGIPAVQE